MEMFLVPNLMRIILQNLFVLLDGVLKPIFNNKHIHVFLVRLSISDVVFIMLINFKMPTIVGI